MDFVEGSVATLFVKAPIGYEVSNIHIIKPEVYDENDEFVSDRIEEDAELQYDDDTNEYYCEVTITTPTEAIITTQKKPGDGTTDMFIDDDSGMVTFCSEYDLDFSTEATKDIAAYVAIGYNSETNFIKADETLIPAYQAYLQLPRHVARGTELISIELIDMGDMNGDAKITIIDAVMIVDKILNEQ